MKIILAGGSGFIGRRLIQKLATARHVVVLLTRNPAAVHLEAWPSVKLTQWDAKSSGLWAKELDGADAVINLAGETLAKRWSSRQKERIVNSRIDATRALVGAVRQAQHKPSVFINGSAVGFYGDVPNDPVPETHPRGVGFLSDVCERWESEARKAEECGVRVVMLRTGPVLGSDGGALQKMALPYKLFVGAPLGSGRQWFPWIHRDDVVRVIQLALEKSDLAGPINLVAPDSVTMKQFCDQLGRTLHRPSWPPVPAFVIRLALGEMAGMLLTGQRVVPSKLIEHGYSFRHPKLDDALRNIFS
ncbi:MAG: TIGR01777 family protein [Ignavibacteriae bacterium]|nr:TIGR01777 family protein [Ignavibacteriota bacterium]